jgi:YjbE family integral membrane protein
MMEYLGFETILDFFSIVLADIVLSGDNAIIIGMAAASLSPELRKKAIIYGMVVAAVLRIIFAVMASFLLGVPGLLFIGGLVLLWVCWGLFKDIRSHQAEKLPENQEMMEEGGYQGVPKRSLASALFAITLADVSMSIDNVLAVAAIAKENTGMLIFGLVLAIVLMGFAATLIVKLLAKYPAISWAGLVILIYVAIRMMYEGWSQFQGLVTGWLA